MTLLQFTATIRMIIGDIPASKSDLEILDLVHDCIGEEFDEGDSFDIKLVKFKGHWDNWEGNPANCLQM